MPTVELKQLVGQRVNPSTGKLERIGWDIDCLILDGREIAKVKRAPGAAIGLYPGVVLKPSEKAAVEDAVAAKRGGIKPSRIEGPNPALYELLDDEPVDTDEGEETEVDDE